MQYLSESKNKLLIAVTLSALIFALFTFSFVAIAELKVKAKSANPINQIAFSGTAEISATPDTASFTVRVYELEQTAEQAEKKSTMKANKILALLKEKGVEKKDIRTQDYRINPKYNYQNHPVYKQILEGYEASQNIAVKVRDLKKVGEILSAISQNQVNEINGPFFEIDNTDKLKLEAQRAAIENAKEKAKETAKNLDLKLGKIIRFYEEPMGNFPPRQMMMAKMAHAENFDAAPEPQIETGEQKITSRVSITYEIE
jgi:uncharacterized protein YggE